MNKNLKKSIKKGIQEYDENPNRNNQLLAKLINSNSDYSCIIKIVSKLLIDKIESQFSLEPVESNPTLFTNNPTNPQQVLFKGTSLTYLSSGNTYELNSPDHKYNDYKN